MKATAAPAFLLALGFLGSVSCGQDRSLDRSRGIHEELIADYLEAWKAFYPTSTVRLGLDQYLAGAEDRSRESISDWIQLNDLVMTRTAHLTEGLGVDLLIDLRLLRNQAESELYRWREERAHHTSPEMYAAAFRGLVDIPETPKRIGEGELEAAVDTRLAAVPELSRAMSTNLVSGSSGEIQGAIRTLRGLLPALEALSSRFPGKEGPVARASDALRAGIDHLEGHVEAGEEEAGFPLGRDRFASELLRYYHLEITPEEVAERALDEIETVRDLIARLSAEYWEQARPGESLPADPAVLVALVSEDMEANRPASQQESLELFTRFALEAEAFVRDEGIATLPPDRTLEIVLTPESAGPAQRIGFVDAPPPFDPDPMTVLSLPTIPDSFPAGEKEDFYRSFNNHFNKFIIIHELFPGHYMQAKIAAANPRQIRIFFPYHPYVEGWATLVEKLALDAGWDDFNKLTYLAHLRKRLENANRAYASVQVHCFGWTEDRVRRFSEEEALLAPQFAESLYGRLQRGPLQMTSYFMGKDMFMEVLKAEQARLGDRFKVKTFSDVVLRAGAVPMDMLPDLLAEVTAGADAGS